MTAPQDNSNNPLDLSALQSLNFGPNWATGNEVKKTSAPREFRESNFGDGGDRRGGGRRPDRRGLGGGERREFRGERPAENAGGNRPGGNRFGGERRDFRGDRGPRRENAGGEFRRPPIDPENREFNKYHPRPQPVADIGFFPEEKTFNVLIKALKASMRTYELFEIAQLILEKPDRFVIGVRALGAEKSAEKKYVFQSVPDGIPFLSESDAVAHVMRAHLDKFFTAEVVEIEPPKGNFQMVSKCGFTGEIIAPPNYHGYQQALREHHAANFPQMSFDRFTARIESVRDQEQINGWLEKMKKVTRYTLVAAKEGDPAQFDNLEAAKAFLLAGSKDQVVRPLTSIRFSAKLLEKMPNGPLRSSIEHDLAFQRRFPLNTANFLRHYLRNAGFIFSKGGSKGFTYVCSVKRKYRTPQTVFADAIQRVFDFVEKNQRIKITDLPAKYLALTEKAADAEPATIAPEPPATPAAEKPVTPETPAETPVAETPAGNETAPAPAPEKAKPAAVDLNDPAVRELLNTVRWLVSEGYVIEYSDGKLFALPVLTEAQMKSMSAAKKKPENKDSAGDEIAANDSADDEIIPATE